MLPCLECPQQLQLYTAVGCRIATRCHPVPAVGGWWLASGQPRTGPIWQVCGRLLGARSKLSRLSSGDAAAAMAAEPARTARERLLTPPILDMRRTDEQLRELCKGILRDSLTPMVALAHHGCEDHCESLVTSALLIRNAASAPETAPQTAYEFDTHHDVYYSRPRRTRISWAPWATTGRATQDEVVPVRRKPAATSAEAGATL